MKNTASKDQNDVSTLIGVLSTDGETIVPIQAGETTHGLKMSDGTTGSDLGPTDATRDENFVPTLLAVSSSDGVTPVVVYGNSSGELLVKST